MSRPKRLSDELRHMADAMDEKLRDEDQEGLCFGVLMFYPDGKSHSGIATNVEQPVLVEALRNALDILTSENPPVRRNAPLASGEGE